MTKVLAWLGTLASIAGSFTVAFHVFVLGYCLFLAGAISWLIVAVSRKDRALGILNATFTLANIVGLYNALA